MLKIKDNVDLKELEKYGFHKRHDCYVENIIDLTLAQQIGVLAIYETDRRIFTMVKFNDKSKEVLLNNDDMYLVPSVDTLYDLIKDDLIEKV